MDDIARDPITDGVATPDAGVERLRRKGPIDELAVRSSDETEALEPPVERFSRLPVVLPLPAEVDPEPEGMDVLSDAVPEPEDGPEDDAMPPAPDETADLAGDLGPGEPPAVPDPLDEPLPEVAAPVTDPEQLVRVVLGLLLTVREGLTVLRLAQTCDTTQEAVRAALDTLRQRLGAAGFPIEVCGQGEGVKLWTTPDVFPYLEKVKGIKKNERLSPAALETLAVIAYRQPVFRAEIEGIRGVKVGPMLRTLLDCKLIKIVGRADVPGRPLQYGTTQLFLERFGLASLKDLPSVKEWKGLQG